MARPKKNTEKVITTAEEIVETKPKRRGRPPKKKIDNVSDQLSLVINETESIINEPTPKKRGRKPKVKDNDSMEEKPKMKKKSVNGKLPDLGDTDEPITTKYSKFKKFGKTIVIEEIFDELNAKVTISGKSGFLEDGVLYNADHIRISKYSKLAHEIMEERIDSIYSRPFGNLIPRPDKADSKLVNGLFVNNETDLENIVRQIESVQKQRISAGSQYLNFIIRLLEAGVDRNEISGDALLYTFVMYSQMENTLTDIMTELSKDIPIIKWMTSILGIGYKHACCLYTYIDISKAPTAGHIWSYAGWDVGYRRRQSGVQSNWNNRFRSRLYLIGDQFIKTQNRPDDIYGHLYAEKLKFYEAKNEAGGFADKAKIELEFEKKKKNPNKQSIALYEEGKITSNHMKMMARRFAVKIFIAHLQEVWWELEYGEPAVKPYVIEHLGHVDRLVCPHKDVVGLV